MLQIAILFTYFLTLLKSLSRYRLKALDALMFVFAMLIYSFRNMYEDDTYVYNLVYLSVGNGAGLKVATQYGMDYGFFVLMKLFASIGVSFVVLRMIVFTVACLLIYSTLKLITENYALVFCLYLYFPFEYDSYQIRQFLAYAIVIFALRFLIMEETHPIKYIILVGIATLIHFTSIAFLIYLLALVKRKGYMKYLVRIVGVLSVLFALGGGNIIGLIGRFVNNDKLLRYSLNSTDYRMNIYLQLFEIVMVVVLLLLDNRILRTRQDEISSQLSVILNLSILFLPMILYSLTFERMIRPFIILTYAVVVSEYDKREKQARYIYLMAIIALVIIRMSVSFGYIANMFADCTLISDL